MIAAGLVVFAIGSFVAAAADDIFWTMLDARFRARAQFRRRYRVDRGCNA